VLLIKRKKAPCKDYWSFPGGKIEQNEHITDAAVREIMEETGIPTKIHKHHGTVSEHLTNNGSVEHNFILHLVGLIPEHTTITEGEEGETEWFDIKDLPNINIIPSDHMIVEQMINKDKHYAESVMERTEEKYEVTRFI
jgi:8-oxo-dGTP diphosphatase